MSLTEYLETITPKQPPTEQKAFENTTDTVLELERTLREVEKCAMNLRKTILDMESAKLLLEGVHDLDDLYRRKLYEEDKATLNINVTYADGELVITLPALLPHRKTKHSVLFGETLQTALKEFRKTDDYREFRETQTGKMLLAIHHNYKTPWMVRDNDNIEIKTLIDSLTYTGIIPTDKGNFLSVYLTADEGEENKCRITLSPKGPLSPQKGE